MSNSESIVVVRRQMAVGELVISLRGTTREATLGGQIVCDTSVQALPAPVVANGVTYTHRIGNVALTLQEHGAIVAAESAYRATPRGQREVLTNALANCAAGARPGSAAWRKEAAAAKALADFDRAHPEVIAAINGVAPVQSGESSLDRG